MLWILLISVISDGFALFLQNGKDYSETPARKLSQSFGLEIVGGKAITPKQVIHLLLAHLDDAQPENIQSL